MDSKSIKLVGGGTKSLKFKRLSNRNGTHAQN